MDSACKYYTAGGIRLSLRFRKYFAVKTSCLYTDANKCSIASSTILYAPHRLQKADLFAAELWKSCGKGWCFEKFFLEAPVVRPILESRSKQGVIRPCEKVGWKLRWLYVLIMPGFTKLLRCSPICKAVWYYRQYWSEILLFCLCCTSDMFYPAAAGCWLFLRELGTMEY